MTYQEVLKYLYSQLPMYQRVGKVAFKKDLSRTIALCEEMNNPQNNFSTVHIAGTNGKGSTSHMIAAVLQSTGLKVGLYTSPHYKDYRERIKVDGLYISKKDVVRFIESHQDTIEKIQPSFFELTVGMAFWYFDKMKVDIAVIETGLGGRLDSTNIITPLCAVITNIGLDHQDMLGDNLPSIAKEKAGIIKMKVPVVVGKKQVETQDVFSKTASEHNAKISYASDLVSVEIGEKDLDFVALKMTVKHTKAYSFKLPSATSYNIENCRTALATIHILQEHHQIEISNSEVVKGLSNFKKLTKYMGRWQVVSKRPTILLDAAHNVDGLQDLLQNLKQLKFDQLHIILGTVKDKSSTGILALLPHDAKYYFVKPDVQRGKEAKVLKKESNKIGLKGRSYVSCKNGLKAAKRAAGKNDLILATGSSFVVAELL